MTVSNKPPDRIGTKSVGGQTRESRKQTKAISKRILYKTRKHSVDVLGMIRIQLTLRFVFTLLAR